MKPSTRILPVLLLVLASTNGFAAGLGGLGGLGGIGGLPRLPLPTPNLPPVMRQVQQIVDNVGRPAQPNAFERDAAGTRVVKSEVLAVSPSDAGLAAARRMNFQVLRQENLGALNLGVTVLRAPPGMSVSDALAALRAADPTGVYDYNHIYDPSMGTAVADNAAANVARNVSVRHVAIGMIDGGVDRDHPELRGAKIVTANVAGREPSPPSEHGTAVASVIAGNGPQFRGALPGATIYAADVYGGSATGGSADAVAQGIAWVVGKGAPVINVSLAGPPNQLVEAVVRAAIARGFVIVAAVGNDGPAAPVQYPAAYDGVIAVTSVDSEHRIQLDANQGPQVAFAAVGVDVPVAMPKKGYGHATGTSFAAPVVAARFALKLPRADAQAAERAYRELQRDAIDLGEKGRDPAFGWGFLEEYAGAGDAVSVR